MGSDSDSDSCSSDTPCEPPPVQAEPLLARQRRHGGVARWILRRECAPREAATVRPFLGVPARLCTPIQSLVDTDRLLLRTVVLGYSRCAWFHVLRWRQGAGESSSTLWLLRETRPPA